MKIYEIKYYNTINAEDIAYVVSINAETALVDFVRATQNRYENKKIEIIDLKTIGIVTNTERRFEEWLLKQCDRDDIVGDLAMDMYRSILSKDFNGTDLEKYLKDRCASREIMNALDEAKEEYLQ